jgi:hypothetical protein
MNRMKPTSVAVLALLCSSAAWASEAETSASAGSNRYQRNGTATATARYSGDIGSARTQSRSGQVSVARGVAWGLDKDGLSLSVSNAVAPSRGPAVATTFNLSIGRDGRVSHSTGLAISKGPIQRSASAGGAASTKRHGGSATAFAAGKSDRFGRVRAVTQSRQHRLQKRVEFRRYRLVRR